MGELGTSKLESSIDSLRRGASELEERQEQELAQAMVGSNLVITHEGLPISPAGVGALVGDVYVAPDADGAEETTDGEASVAFTQGRRGPDGEEVEVVMAEFLDAGDGDGDRGEQDEEGDLAALAEFLGIDPDTEPQLMWIARQCLEAQLPAAWSEYFEEATGNAYYFNKLTEITSAYLRNPHHSLFEQGDVLRGCLRCAAWEHPLDSHFKAIVQEARLSHAARQVLSTRTDAALDNLTAAAAGSRALALKDTGPGSCKLDYGVEKPGWLTGTVGGLAETGPAYVPEIRAQDLDLRMAPRMVQSTDGQPLDLSDLIASASSTQNASPARLTKTGLLSPKSVAAQMILLSSDSDSDSESDRDAAAGDRVGGLIPHRGSADVSSPACSDQSSLDVDALETSLLEHHRSTSPSPQQQQQQQQRRQHVRVQALSLVGSVVTFHFWNISERLLVFSGAAPCSARRDHVGHLSTLGGLL